MKELRYVWVNVLQTLLRMLPFPCSTGLMKIGNPGRDAPVLLTCNFGLTVERIKRVLEGLDVYLLVANSRGVNVWCAATGGLMTDHDVVSVLKTSGIEKFVDHRRVTHMTQNPGEFLRGFFVNFRQRFRRGCSRSGSDPDDRPRCCRRRDNRGTGRRTTERVMAHRLLADTGIRWDREPVAAHRQADKPGRAPKERHWRHQWRARRARPWR